MDVTFLEALYELCSCPGKGNMLYEHYLHLPHTRQSGEAVSALQEGGNPFELDSAIGDCMAAYERQGFVNGVRFGAMLAGELGHTLVPNALLHPETVKDKAS